MIIDALAKEKMNQKNFHQALSLVAYNFEKTLFKLENTTEQLQPSAIHSSQNMQGKHL